jgi:ferric-chelate reductase
VPACIPYVAAACVFYLLDHVVRAIKTRVTTAKLRPLPELGITRVEVPSINAGWRAGQHVRLRVLSPSMGWWGWSEVHPFTIANVAETSEGMVLMCKKTGRWTDSLFSMAQTASYGETGKEVGRDVRVMVEGPYGALSCYRGVDGISSHCFLFLQVAWDIPLCRAILEQCLLLVGAASPLRYLQCRI